MQEIGRLTNRNSELESELKTVKASLPARLNGAPLADLDDTVDVEIDYKVWFNGSSREYSKTVTTTWGKLFALISPKLIEHPSDATMKTYIGQELLAIADVKPWAGKASLVEQSHNTVRVHFEALGLIVVDYAKTVGQGMGVFWNLTDRGTSLMTEMRAVRKK